MTMSIFNYVLTAVCLFKVASTQSFPKFSTSKGNTVTSAWKKDIRISSNDASSVCETTEGVKSFSGYVEMGPSSLAEVNGYPGYTANYFYWFFESRKDPADSPFVIWIGGGPGFSSIASAIQENGPCNVNDDSNSTTLNPWSWNNEANILYIDQPSMTGYSFDKPVHATVDGLNQSLPIIPSSGVVPEANSTFRIGTFGSQDPTKTANSTGNAAAVFWTFTQAWMSENRIYKPKDNKINIWTESYGGRYGPLFAQYLDKKNKQIATGSIDAIPLKLNSLGIVNGYIDPFEHSKSYPRMASNSTYGIKIPQAVTDSMNQNLTKEGGCLSQIKTCYSLSALDPSNDARNSTINGVCAQAFLFCEAMVQSAFIAASGRNKDDIAHPTLDPFPLPFYIGFLNQNWVQSTLGAQVNFTDNAGAVLQAFVQTGDLGRDGGLSALGELLDAGVKVTLMYGDRDYQVNWLGGEEISLKLPWAGKKQFNSAGYEHLKNGNGSQSGGVVRQAGPLSFVRVFQAGHQAPAYQPEVAYRIYQRSLRDVDIATGLMKTTKYGNGSSDSNNSMLVTQGPLSSFGIKSKAPIAPVPVCYTLSIPFKCTPDKVEWLAKGTAIIKDFIVVGNRNSTGSSVDGAVSSGTNHTGSQTPGNSVKPSSKLTQNTTTNSSDVINTGMGASLSTSLPWWSSLLVAVFVAVLGSGL